MSLSVLISGAGIGGPSLAFWLGRLGYRVTVVEQSPVLRAGGGAAVDFRGEQVALLERMGVLADIRAHETGMGDQLIVDAAGRTVSRFPSALFSGEVEIDRGDLARILYRHSSTDADYIFGDRITAIDQDADTVRVQFAHGPSRSYDLVVGADGLHSGVRRLVFGDEDEFRSDLGYYVAAFSVPNTFGLDHSGLIYNEPGRYLSLGSARDPERAVAGFIFSAPPTEFDRREVGAQKRFIADHFAGVGWRAPQLLAALQDAADLYFDSLSQIRLDRWSDGRVALLGDAAWCAGPGGNGTGHAMLGAYTLAGELAAADGDHRIAFARYERIMRPPVEKSQKFATGAGRFLAPATRWQIRRRDLTYRVLSSAPMSGIFTRMSSRSAKTGTPASYPLPVA
ncbi:2-polyprenyl-6-methoxyphenol hydroxylase-like FAD-dependent oxidoreductase [Nocardia kruczakiae]|uniref:2-polyprenyl-6-methoxyphenol hydroxylase-like FAD-dependent oxidoreductase n=1 Tax=Nocardia kruczakiae TaxID=261477 RepID=A0ABU1XEV9_9NOCA|nr:FAD-dependent monooxygenase [Nocardia kruczakiae]MDR7168542.1 2-polyprenyl-6-methoxyphenol hydroxylase-like FAD-dependent oxidoreductase [Nocardia kruczakiae]